MSYYFAIIGTKDNPLFEHEFGTSKAGGDGVAHFRPEARQTNQFIVHSSLDLVDEIQWTTSAMYLKNVDRFYNNYISCFLTAAGARFLLLHNPEPGAGWNAHLFPLAHLYPSAAAPGSDAALGSSSSGDGARAVTSITTGNNYPPPFTPSPLASTASVPSTSVSEKRSSSAFSALTGYGSNNTGSTGANSVSANPLSPVAEEATRQFFAEVYESWVKAVMSPFYTVDMPVTSRVFRSRVAAAGRKWL